MRRHGRGCWTPQLSKPDFVLDVFAVNKLRPRELAVDLRLQVGVNEPQVSGRHVEPKIRLPRHAAWQLGVHAHILIDCRRRLVLLVTNVRVAAFPVRRASDAVRGLVVHQVVPVDVVVVVSRVRVAAVVTLCEIILRGARRCRTENVITVVSRLGLGLTDAVAVPHTCRLNVGKSKNWGRAVLDAPMRAIRESHLCCDHKRALVADDLKTSTNSKHTIRERVVVGGKEIDARDPRHVGVVPFVGHLGVVVADTAELLQLAKVGRRLSLIPRHVGCTIRLHVLQQELAR